MKKIILLGLLIFSQTILIKPVFASNYEDMFGVYIAPRIGFHFTTMHDINLKSKNYSINLDSYNNFIIRGGLGLGYDFSKKFNVPLRTEVEFLAVNKMRDTQTVSNSSVSGTVSLENKMYSLFSNTYYDFYNNSKFTPYVGLGFGGFFTKIHGNFSLNEIGSFPQTNNFNFSCNASTGISYAYNKNVSFDALYRIAFYHDATSTYNSQTEAIDLKAKLIMNQLFLIARLTF